MIEAYFESVEKTIRAFSHVWSYTLSKKVYNVKQGFIRGVILLDDDARLEFAEVKDVDVSEKIKYRYQYMDKDHTIPPYSDVSPS